MKMKVHSVSLSWWCLRDENIITQQLHHYDHRRDSDARNECMITAIPDRMPRRKSRYKEDDSSESSSVPERY